MAEVFVIAEIGINHNGDIAIAKKLIAGAENAGANAVKFQKRTIDSVYSKEELDKVRESPWGDTNREQKLGLEFEKEEFDVIDTYCKELDIHWFASAWDHQSQEFIREYQCKYNKVASAMLTDRELLEMIAEERKHTFISTGMSSYEEIDKAVEIFENRGCPYELMHCNSTYPMPDEKAHLRVIPEMRKRYDCKVGYSGHEVGLITSIAAVALGASSLERHITLDRSMYGSDQAASVELSGFHRLVEYVRTVEKALGGTEKIVHEEEIAIKEKLRKVDTL